jgi:hypothetical protein
VTPTSRGSVATVVAVVSPRTSAGVREVLGELASSGVRPILISLGAGTGVQRVDEERVTIIEDLRPSYLDNAVAALRLSSLPTLAWWRADQPEVLEALATLVDRVVLDVEDPSAVWPLVPALVDRTTVSGMRWARLTRWRDLIAQFFDLPEVAEMADRFDRLELRGGDRHTMRLLGGWLRSRLPAGDRLDVTIDVDRDARETLRLIAPGGVLGVRLQDGSCLETSVQAGAGSSVRVVPAGDDRPVTLLSEELRVRSRDAAFEDAVRAAEKL